MTPPDEFVIDRETLRNVAACFDRSEQNLRWQGRVDKRLDRIERKINGWILKASILTAFMTGLGIKVGTEYEPIARLFGGG